MIESFASAAGAAYDRTPYPRVAFPQSHPHTLGAMARLFGLDAPDPARARVLELGCAEGGNLLPMAQHAPAAQFLGIDASARQIGGGRAAIAATRLTNVELRVQDIMEFSAAEGKFDYIIVHGIFSWVPEPVREKILAICHDQLAPTGVAYVSFNTLPGWNLRGVMRDMLRFYAEDRPDARTDAAQLRAFGAFLADATPAKNSPFGDWLREEVAELKGSHDGYLSHEFLGDTNQAFYFFEFMQRTERAGLRYLGEPALKRMLSSVWTPKVAETLERLKATLEAKEQYMDFVRNRTFREALLCHRAPRLVRAIMPAAMKRFHFSSNLLPPAPGSLDLRAGLAQRFTSRGPAIGTVDTAESLLKSAFDTLAHCQHRRISFAALLAAAREKAGAYFTPTPADEELLAGNLLNVYSNGMVDIHAGDVPIQATASARPRATALARYEARHFRSLTNLAHKTITFDPLGCHILAECDGEHDAGAIVESVVAAVGAGKFSMSDGNATMTDPARIRAFTAGRIDTILQGLADHGLFTA